VGSAWTTKATTPFPRGRVQYRGDTAGKNAPSPACACPSWHEAQAGRWHGPCPDAPKGATGGIPAVSPRRTGGTVQADTAADRTPNTLPPARGRRIAHQPGLASPDPVRQVRRRQRGHGTGPLSHVGILALQRGEDVNRGGCRMAKTMISCSVVSVTTAMPLPNTSGEREQAASP
jgi:hypothetical protein